MTWAQIIPLLWYIAFVGLLVLISLVAPHLIAYLRASASKLQSELHLSQLLAAERLWWRLLQPELGALELDMVPVLARLGTFVASATGLPMTVVVAFGTAIANELLQAFRGQTPTVTPPAPPAVPTAPSTISQPVASGAIQFDPTSSSSAAAQSEPAAADQPQAVP